METVATTFIWVHRVEGGRLCVYLGDYGNKSFGAKQKQQKLQHIQ